MANANQIVPITTEPTNTYPQPILTAEERNALRAQWKQIVTDHTANCRAWYAMTGEDRCLKQKPVLFTYTSLLYAVLLGRDWRKGFTPIRNTRKLANGSMSNWSYWQAANMLPTGNHLSLYESPKPPSYLGVFNIFLASIPLRSQVTSLRRLPKLPRWTEGMTIGELEAAWPKNPYLEETSGDIASTP